MSGTRSSREQSPTARLRALINRTDRVLSVLHPPNAACARIMEKAGCEVGFVGTGGVVGAYTGLADVGALTMLECVTVAGWIAQAVKFPVIMDGDTGHGGIMAGGRGGGGWIPPGLPGGGRQAPPIQGKRQNPRAGGGGGALGQAGGPRSPPPANKKKK